MEHEQLREKLIERVESYTGSLRSMEWHHVTTTDISKILIAIVDSWTPNEKDVELCASMLVMIEEKKID